MTITAVQTRGATVDANATGSLGAFGASVAVGNLVVVAACKDASGSAFVAGNCTKAAGTATIGTVQLDKEAHLDLGGGIGERRVGIWSVLVTGAGTLTMQVAGAAGNYWVLGEGEFHSDVGWDSSRLEASNSASSATDNASSATSGNGTSAGKALFVGVCVSESTSSNTVTFTPDAAFTQIYEEENGSAHLVGSIIYQIVGAGTTDAADWAIAGGGGNAGYAAALAVYKETGGGGGGPTGPPPGTLMQMGMGT